jgi:hypothetical protein
MGVFRASDEGFRFVEFSPLDGAASLAQYQLDVVPRD